MTAIDADALSRLASGQWAPGHSGNPKGRPPTPGVIRRLIAARQFHALARIYRNIEHGGDQAANTAAIWLVEQHIGKPVQQIDAQVTDLGAAHLLAVSQQASTVLDAAPEPEPEPEPAPLLDWAGLPAPVQLAPVAVPEFAPLPEGRRDRR